MIWMLMITATWILMRIGIEKKLAVFNWQLVPKFNNKERSVIRIFIYNF